MLVTAVQDLHQDPSRSMRIAALAQDRNNNFNLIRALAATAVIFSHSYALSGHGEEEPLLRWTNSATHFGMLGVTLFFVISGFLVTRSFTARGTLVAFAAARILRIYPALIAAALFSVAMAGAFSTVPWRDFLLDPQTLRFVVNDSVGWRIEFFLPGAFVENAVPRAVNGSLWTIPIELRMYVGCAIAGALTLLARRVLFNAVFVAGVILFAVRSDWFVFVSNVPDSAQLVLSFALGAFAWVNRDWIPVSLLAAATALLVLAINPGDIIRGPLFEVLVAYALLTLALHPGVRFAGFNRLGDYSYGLYLYAYPIQQALVHAQPRIGSWALFAEASVLTFGAAICSWHGIEKAALTLKSRFSEPDR
jgi:peptidoglycan/LPS O-acetylase OafA/YrhL